MELNQIHNQDCITYMKSLPDKCIDLVVTDPPYKGISGGSHRKKGQPSGILSKNDGKLFKHNNINPELWIPEIYRVLKSETHCYIMTNTINLENYLRICREVGFGLHNLLCWEKNNCTPSQYYMKNCEYVLFLRKGKAKWVNNIGGSKTVHQFNSVIGNKIHPTEKPVELMKFYIANSSKEGDIVFDPFCGAGSTLIAAKELNRKYIGCEIDIEYYKIALKRLVGRKTDY